MPSDRVSSGIETAGEEWRLLQIGRCSAEERNAELLGVDQTFVWKLQIYTERMRSAGRTRRLILGARTGMQPKRDRHGCGKRGKRHPPPDADNGAGLVWNAGATENAHSVSVSR